MQARSAAQRILPVYVLILSKRSRATGFPQAAKIAQTGTVLVLLLTTTIRFMQTNIIWTGIEYHSLENCVIDNTAKGTNIHSTIIGLYEGKIYKVDYHIQTNENWETLFVELKARHSNSQQHFILEGDGKGNWIMNGKQMTEWTGCIDVDIPLTPFTNTLPVNRLRLQQGAEQEITVIYLDVLEWKTHPVRQQYRRLSETAYHYENVPNDFEADIETDMEGFVVNYPLLFTRSSGLRSDYH